MMRNSPILRPPLSPDIGSAGLVRRNSSCSTSSVSIGLGIDAVSDRQSSPRLPGSPVFLTSESNYNQLSTPSRRQSVSPTPSFLLSTDQSTAGDSRLSIDSDRSGLHNRQMSLTSACLPATATPTSATTSSRIRPSLTPLTFGSASAKRDGTSSPTPSSGKWGTSWFAPKSVDVEKSKNKDRLRHSHPSALQILAGPFAPFLIFATSHSQPNESPKRRYSLIIRLCSCLYIVFALYSFTAHVILPTPPNISTSTAQALLSQTAAHLDLPMKWAPFRHHSQASPSALHRKSTLYSSTIPSQNPLSDMSHQLRFAKMHSKYTASNSEAIEAFVFGAEDIKGKGDVTACLYANEVWLDQSMEFVKRWDGPVSLVIETLSQRGNSKALLDRLNKLRKQSNQIRKLVDVHFAHTHTKDALNSTYQRFIANPVASNVHVNVARFFARTNSVWLVGDPRIIPSPGLRKTLSSEIVQRIINELEDAVVIPTFAPLRSQPMAEPDLSILHTEQQLKKVGAQYVQQHITSLALDTAQWPTSKESLVSLVSSLNKPLFGLHEPPWDLNSGPTNYALWKKRDDDPDLELAPSQGGGLGLGLDSSTGGGGSFHRIAEYDLHYSPSVVIAKDLQPWCTERFEWKKEACGYQMYLAGAKMWVLPDEWAFTLAPIESTSRLQEDSAVAHLKSSINSRLYTKFHQEACMHYGRQFLSMGLWNENRAKHLRFSCARVLSSYGMGLAANPGGTINREAVPQIA